MALEACRSCLSCLLIPLALWSIVVNVLLYFPNGNASYATSFQLPNYVWYFEGICFSGVMVSVDFMDFFLMNCNSTANNLGLRGSKVIVSLKGKWISLSKYCRQKKLIKLKKL